MEMENENLNEKLDSMDSKISYLSTLTSECISLVKYECEDECKECEASLKETYLHQEYNELESLVNELKEKIENLKNLLLTDSICPHEVNYKDLINQKIEENRKQRNFMDAFGPYMLLHQLNS